MECQVVMVWTIKKMWVQIRRIQRVPIQRDQGGPQWECSGAHTKKVPTSVRSRGLTLGRLRGSTSGSQEVPHPEIKWSSLRSWGPISGHRGSHQVIGLTTSHGGLHQVKEAHITSRGPHQVHNWMPWGPTSVQGAKSGGLGGPRELHPSTAIEFFLKTRQSSGIIGLLHFLHSVHIYIFEYI